MEKKQYWVFAVFVGVQSFFLQLFDQTVGMRLIPGAHAGFVFLAFQSWALYFLLGSKVKGAVKGFLGYVLGIFFSAAMMFVTSWFAGMGIFAVPLAALIVVPFMMYFEFAPWCISNVAAFFVGAGAFFGINSYVSGITAVQSGLVVLLYCGLGLFSGFISIIFREWLEHRVYRHVKEDIKHE